MSEGSVRVVRLTNGEDIIAFFEEEENYVLLASPMSMLFKRLPSGKAVLMLTPWIPFELIEDDIVSISYNDILTVMNPKSNIIENYIQSLLDNDSEQMETSSDDEDFVNDDLDDSFIDEMINISNKESNKTIH